MDTDEAVEHAQHHVEEHDVTPIPVAIIAPKVERTVAADVASFRTVTILATDSAPFPLLGLDRMRHKAQILVHNPPGVAAPAIAPYCYMAKRNQIAANGDARGSVLMAGDNFPYEAAAEVWIVPAGVAVSLTVIEERNV